MKPAAFIAICFLFYISTGPAHADGPTLIDSTSLQGKRIKILNPDIVNKLFDKPPTAEPDGQLVLADGQIQTRPAARASGAIVICQFSYVAANENGYFPFFDESVLGVIKVDSISMPTMNLTQLMFIVHHSNPYIGKEHFDLDFNCSNQAGTIFSREALDAAFGSILSLE